MASFSDAETVALLIFKGDAFSLHTGAIDLCQGGIHEWSRRFVLYRENIAMSASAGHVLFRGHLEGQGEVYGVWTLLGSGLHHLKLFWTEYYQLISRWRLLRHAQLCGLVYIVY